MGNNNSITEEIIDYDRIKNDTIYPIDEAIKKGININDIYVTYQGEKRHLIEIIAENNLPCIFKYAITKNITLPLEKKDKIEMLQMMYESEKHIFKILSEEFIASYLSENTFYACVEHIEKWSPVSDTFFEHLTGYKSDPYLIFLAIAKGYKITENSLRQIYRFNPGIITHMNSHDSVLICAQNYINEKKCKKCNSACAVSNEYICIACRNNEINEKREKLFSEVLQKSQIDNNSNNSNNFDVNTHITKKRKIKK
jgi:hypothetical protein